MKAALAGAGVGDEIACLVGATLRVGGAARLAFLGREIAVGETDAGSRRAIGDAFASTAFANVVGGARAAAAAMERIGRRIDALPIAALLIARTAG
jgi:hypothetical protein